MTYIGKITGTDLVLLHIIGNVIYEFYYHKKPRYMISASLSFFTILMNDQLLLLTHILFLYCYITIKVLGTVIMFTLYSAGEHHEWFCFTFFSGNIIFDSCNVHPCQGMFVLDAT